jgi:hypothetical protein
MITNAEMALQGLGNPVKLFQQVGSEVLAGSWAMISVPTLGVVYYPEAEKLTGVGTWL